jgi:RloB-like protein
MTARFRRKLGQRRYRRMFVIVAEGTVTEQEYFPLLSDESIVHIKCLKNRRGLTPREALKRVHALDEAWVVVDKDQWPEEHLSELHAWSQTKGNYGFALSNPKFEIWLLLHFEDAVGAATGHECDRRLANYLPAYDKHVSLNRFSNERIAAAVARAKTRDTPPCADWPRNPGTTVYRLVEKILQAGA